MGWVPTSFHDHASALRYACMLAPGFDFRLRVHKGASGRWLVTVVRP